MPTGTAGDTGHRLSFAAKPFIHKKILYSDWSGTNNDRREIGVLPPYAVITAGAVWITTGFNDTTGDDLDVGVLGTDDDLFHSACDVNTGTVYTAFDDLADANRYSASARTVTVNFTTAPTGDGTTGEAHIFLEYFIADATSI